LTEKNKVGPKNFNWA